MRKTLILWCMLFPTVLFAQHHSWDGQGLFPTAKTRCLNVFVNIIYDVHPTIDVFSDTTYWPPVTNPALEGINDTTIPNYLLDWMDTVYVPGQLHGTCTRIYGESSFDSLQITGDFIVVNIRESTICHYGGFSDYSIKQATFDLIRQKGFSTIYGHNQIADYDYNGNNKFDYVNFLVRNITYNYGGYNPGSGYNGISGSLYINGMAYYIEQGTFQCVGDGDFYKNPTNIVTHEISHSLFGGNEFHTSGGNHRGSIDTMAFLNIQYGYGLMGAAGSGLVCCNGYERWRMHWKHPQSADYISAQNSDGFVSVVSDVSKENGNVSFVLRDFVTYGDAIRIKLPYKDREISSNQYIWLENHQIRDDKLDFLQYSNTTDCRPRGKAGVYAYYQIGRDVLEGTINEVWDKYHRDNLKIIPAEGYYDYVREADTYNLHCVADGELYYALRQDTPNAFCGGQDQERQFFPLESDSILYVSQETVMWRKSVNEWNDDHLACLGDSLDAFIPPLKINMGTNPSTCNAKTYHSYNNATYSGYIVSASTDRNTQTTYLTGLSIEIVNKERSNIRVNIRWDDYDITNDTRWTGKIALKDTAILTTPYSITLAQNRTVALPYRDPETGLFAGRTQWTCEAGSYFRQDDSTHVFLTENSSLVFQSGSTYEQSENAVMHVQEGCTLHVQDGANMLFMGTLEIDSGAVAILNGTIHFGNAARLIVRPGGVLIVNGGTLTSAGAGAMWQGIELVGDRTKRQELQYQGTVELKNGAVIENAITAIRTGIQGDNWLTTGGIIVATDAVFRNNQQAVEFLSYNDTISSTNIRDNCSVFARCVFTIDTNNLLAINGGGSQVTYWYSSSNSSHYPSLTYMVVTSSQGVTSNSCQSTILDIYPYKSDYSTTELESIVSLYQQQDSVRVSQLEVTEEGTYDIPPVSSEMMELQQEASELYHEVVRNIMLDSLTDMAVLYNWHSAASIFADPYSLSETRYQMEEISDYVDFSIEDSAERDNYAAFRTLKSECALLTAEKGVNWFALSEGQIEELVRIAELNTGRSSVMAKGILCFFFGICYDDEAPHKLLQYAFQTAKRISVNFRLLICRALWY